MEITEELRQEFHDLCDRLLEIYNLFPQNGSLRKIIAGTDVLGSLNTLMLFQATQEEVLHLYEYINGLENAWDIQL